MKVICRIPIKDISSNNQIVEGEDCDAVFELVRKNHTIEERVTITNLADNKFSISLSLFKFAFKFE